MALWISVPIEFFPLDAPPGPVKPLGSLEGIYPNFWTYSGRDYGLRIGIYRIMRVLDATGLRASAIMNATVATRFPRIIDELKHRDWEIAAGGLDMGQVHHGKLEPEREREMVRRCLEILEQASGRRIRGWHSPGYSQSSNTLSLLAKAGIDYVMDWANDDMPFAMRTPAGPLCAMPLTYEWSDRFLLVHHNLTVEDYEAQVLRAFRRLEAEARQSKSGRILSLSITPWILGYPHRIAALERMLGTILATDAVWPANGAEIVDQFNQKAL
jgi:peptidoglycan/xylan/chitin deacetylase (PgdA/CDA1 family)